MHLRERVELARQTYLQAVVTTRANSTPANWKRLLAAARNLHSAVRERDAARAPARSRAPKVPLAARVPAHQRAAPRKAAATPPAKRDGSTRAAGGAALQPGPHPLLRPKEEELQRTRGLRKQSRRPASQARRSARSSPRSSQR